MTVSGAREKRGNIWGQLAVSACALLLPPLGMTAGVLYLGSPLQEASSIATALEAVPAGPIPAPVASRPDAAPDLKGNFGLASAAEQPVAAEQKSALAPPAIAARPTAPQLAAPPPDAARRAAAATAGAEDSARFSPSEPVTLVHGGATAEPEALAEAAPAAETPAEASAATAPAAAIAVPEAPASATPAQTRTARKPRHEARAAPRTTHIPTLSEIFLGPARRSR
jgi:hypothetical protein